MLQVRAYLSERAGETVSRNELAHAVWPGVIVGDDALSNTINEIRKAFGDDSHEYAIVEPFRKRAIGCW